MLSASRNISRISGQTSLMRSHLGFLSSLLLHLAAGRAGISIFYLGFSASKRFCWPRYNIRRTLEVSASAEYLRQLAENLTLLQRYISPAPHISQPQASFSHRRNALLPSSRLCWQQRLLASARHFSQACTCSSFSRPPASLSSLWTLTPEQTHSL